MYRGSTIESLPCLLSTSKGVDNQIILENPTVTHLTFNITPWENSADDKLKIFFSEMSFDS